MTDTADARARQAVGILHPGAMGSSLMAAAPGPVLWAGEGRSTDSAARAAGAGGVDTGSLDALVADAHIVVSVCPPGAALELAQSVAALGFNGIYCDANAIAPATARQIASLFPRFVDGGIVGPPVSSPTSTRLYLSGTEAAAVAEIWRDTDLAVNVVGAEAGQASAVKMAYAGWTKGSSALLLAMRALARAEGVEDALLAEWAISQKDLEARAQFTAAMTGPKAWRFTGEMAEIASTMRDAGLPHHFHAGAEELYGRLASLKGASSPELDEVLDLILGADS